MDIEKFINENTMLNEVHTQLFSKNRLIQLLDKYGQALQLQQTDVISSACNEYIEGINMQCARCDEPKYKHKF
jgi:hypothetical protein